MGLGLRFGFGFFKEMGLGLGFGFECFGQVGLGLRFGFEFLTKWVWVWVWLRFEFFFFKLVSLWNFLENFQTLTLSKRDSTYFKLTKVNGQWFVIDIDARLQFCLPMQRLNAFFRTQSMWSMVRATASRGIILEWWCSSYHRPHTLCAKKSVQPLHRKTELESCVDINDKSLAIYFC
jgi:hypothetical protein